MGCDLPAVIRGQLTRLIGDKRTLSRPGGHNCRKEFIRWVAFHIEFRSLGVAELLQDIDVGIARVALVGSRMKRYTLGAEIKTPGRKGGDARIVTAARITQERDLVDIYRESCRLNPIPC